MQESTLLLEIGSEAYNELSADERSLLLSAYSDDQSKLAGMKAFELLMKKFQPAYRMGRMYEDLSAKFEKYQQIYMMYASAIKAGRIGSPVGEDKVVERNKFLHAHSKLKDAIQ